MFKYYNPRFKIQVNNMSKKQLLTLATSLAGAPANLQSDVNKIISFSKDLGSSALKKIIAGVIEHPLAEVNLNLTIEKEAKLFVLFDSLLTNKYYNCIKVGLEDLKQNPEKKVELEDFIVHNIKMDSSEFKKRAQVEKDGFFTGNKLLCSKTVMWMVTESEYTKKMLKEQKNG
jgi:hypothetical protein